MIIRTAAIVLRVSPFSSTSHVVTWLTPRYGRLATVVKGACRPKSHFLGQYDLSYTCELLYYARERNGLHMARACCPLKLREHLRSDWRAVVFASYLCGLISRVSVPGKHHGEVFDLMDTALDRLSSCGAEPAVLFWFEQHLAGMLGVAPQLSKCAACQVASPIGSKVVFSAAQGGILCDACSRSVPEDAFLSLSSDVHAILTRWQTSPHPHVAASTRCTPRQLLVIRRILGTFLEYHLDVIPRSRAIALDLARSTDG